MRANPMTPAERAIHRLLQDRALVQGEVADLIGCSEGHASRILSGQHPLPALALGRFGRAGYRELLEAEVRDLGGTIEWGEERLDDEVRQRTTTQRAVAGVTHSTEYAATAVAAEDPRGPGGAEKTTEELRSLLATAEALEKRFHAEACLARQQLADRTAR